MGQSTSKPTKKIAIDCKYNKTDFMLKLAILKDAYELSNYYGNEFISKTQLPNKLLKYINYNETTEQYFNTKRKDSFDELTDINPKIRNYYDFYMALNTFNVEYERPDMTEFERRNKLKNVFDISYKIVQLLVEELGMSCSTQ
jgi:hypothetical protein